MDVSTANDDGAGFERVHTMTDYYDGPRGGIADFRGTPHLYTSRYDDLRGELDTYELRAVDEETFRLALEDWEMWLRWKDAFDAGATTSETQPTLPADRARYDEIAPILEERLRSLDGPVIVAHGDFRPAPGHETGERGRALVVRWTPADR